MKKRILYATLIISVLTPVLASAQKAVPARPPARVRQAVSKMFPGAGVVEWKLKSDHFYEAEFKIRGVEIAAKFDSLGGWRETETAASPSSLPGPVRTSMSKMFAGYKLIETQTLLSVTRRDTLYELHFDNGKEIAKAQFDAHGSVVSRSGKPKK